MSEKQDTLQISIRHDVTGYPSFVIHGLCGEQKHDEALLESYRKLFEATPALLEALKELLSISGYTYMNDEQLKYEHEAGNEGIPPIIKARAAIALAQGT